MEQPLQSLAGERFPLRPTSTEEFARLDVAASGVWGGRFERSFMDVRVINPHAPSNAKMSTPAVASLRGNGAVRRKSPPEPSAELAVVECQLAL